MTDFKTRSTGAHDHLVTCLNRFHKPAPSHRIHRLRESLTAWTAFLQLLLVGLLIELHRGAVRNWCCRHLVRFAHHDVISTQIKQLNAQMWSSIVLSGQRGELDTRRRIKSTKNKFTSKGRRTDLRTRAEPTCFLLLLTSLPLCWSRPLQRSYGERNGTFDVSKAQMNKCWFWLLWSKVDRRWHLSHVKCLWGSWKRSINILILSFNYYYLLLLLKVIPVSSLVALLMSPFCHLNTFPYCRLHCKHSNWLGSCLLYMYVYEVGLYLQLLSYC